LDTFAHDVERVNRPWTCSVDCSIADKCTCIAYVESLLIGGECYSIRTTETVSHGADAAVLGIEAVDLVRPNWHWPIPVFRAVHRVSELYASVLGDGDVVGQIEGVLTIRGDQVGGIVGRPSIKEEYTSGRIIEAVALAKIDEVVVCFCLAVLRSDVAKPKLGKGMLGTLMVSTVTFAGWSRPDTREMITVDLLLLMLGSLM
jgi:hypothetical protein